VDVGVRIVAVLGGGPTIAVAVEAGIFAWEQVPKLELIPTRRQCEDDERAATGKG
tara:strand:- start:684 stop:848 length:165 start_codon:yes stop_codon:yes gene_type:complete